MKKFLIVIAGPTASGKTPLSISIAKQFRCEIISADARQFYLEMNIGTAKPTIDELSQAPHHFINHLSIHDECSAGKFEREAIALLNGEFANHAVSILVGGSGLFIKAVLEGFDSFPATDKNVLEKLKQLFYQEGIGPLQKLLLEHDPAYYQIADRQNPQRLIRALTVSLSSGKPYSFFRNQKPKERNFIPVKIGLEVDRDELHRRINVRVDQMMKNDLLDEVRRLFPFRHLNALQTVGYAELFQFLEGKISLDQAVEQIKLNTRHYAKRQMTWFKKESNMNWFQSHQENEIIQFIQETIHQSSANPHAT